MAKINIEDNNSETVNVGVPPIKQFRVTLQVRERAYKISKKGENYISLKVEILSPEFAPHKTPEGLKKHVIAGQTFNVTLMLEGKAQNSTRQICDILGINFQDLCEDTENPSALNVFDNLTFIGLIDATARPKMETNAETGELQKMLDAEGKEVLGGTEVNLAPWNIIGLA